MKKSVVHFFFFTFSAFLLSFGFASCSNASQIGENFDETDTLRYTAEKLYSTTNWTEAIETDRLTASVSSVKGISSKLNLTPLILAASVPAEDSKLFPNLKNFGSLDTSLISPSLRKTLTSFCEALSKNDDGAAESFFKKENLYSLALFYIDFKRIFDQTLGISEYEKTQAEATEEKKPEVAFFDTYMLGQPFLDGIYYEVPVLLVNKKATLTLSVFCFEDSGSWKIDQVQIADWEIF